MQNKNCQYLHNIKNEKSKNLPSKFVQCAKLIANNKKKRLKCLKFLKLNLKFR